jgi:hypothetical protein
MLKAFVRRLRRLPEVPGAPAVVPEVRASVHENGLVLLHIPSGKIFQSNRTGSQIWQGLSRGLQPDAISMGISHDYGVALDLVRQHTSSFLAELMRHGFVTRTGSANS